MQGTAAPFLRMLGFARIFCFDLFETSIYLLYEFLYDRGRSLLFVVLVHILHGLFIIKIILNDLRNCAHGVVVVECSIRGVL